MFFAYIHKEGSVKKLTAVAMMLFLAGAIAAPAFADTGDEQIKNLKTGARNVGTGWVEVMDTTHDEMSKAKTPGEQMTGLVAGSAIGARRVLHRAGAGAIDILTFWIPKKQPLITPEKPRLE